ncbi:hypothetical protein BpHYR1_009695 [Brachionus plicatilis]|uniref:Uncharacterized protein n=1 Tax=Brachionus plicatilis TaxID=10195 RepID=A0A3M7QZE8_BRAPC|nr:hypothetical protein BpHYR1_009695 [Brachionus plicatilis]
MSFIVVAGLVVCTRWSTPSIESLSIINNRHLKTLGRTMKSYSNGVNSRERLRRNVIWKEVENAYKMPEEE